MTNSREKELRAKVSELSSKVATWRKTEGEEIWNALKRAKGKRILAAILLGIGKTTLYRKLKKFGIGDQFDYRLGNVNRRVRLAQKLSARVKPWRNTEEVVIRAALKKTEGDLIVAAALLGLGKTAMRRKIQEFRLQHVVGPGNRILRRELSDRLRSKTQPTVLRNRSTRIPAQGAA